MYRIDRVTELESLPNENPFVSGACPVVIHLVALDLSRPIGQRLGVRLGEDRGKTFLADNVDDINSMPRLDAGLP
jgi:hypothetical protein